MIATRFLRAGAAAPGAGGACAARLQDKKKPQQRHQRDVTFRMA